MSTPRNLPSFLTAAICGCLLAAGLTAHAAETANASPSPLQQNDDKKQDQKGNSYTVEKKKPAPVPAIVTPVSPVARKPIEKPPPPKAPSVRTQPPSANPPPLPSSAIPSARPPSSRPEPEEPRDRRPTSSGNTNTIEDRALIRRIGLEKFGKMLASIKPGPAQGSSNGDAWFDSGTPRTGEDSVGAPAGTTTRRDPVAREARADYKPATVETASKAVNIYGSQGGGVVLEGAAEGIGHPARVRYRSEYNAFILDERKVYFMSVPPRTVALLCRAIARDDKDRLGVSLGENLQLLYGDGLKRDFPDSRFAWDLKLADRFLGDIVFANNSWTGGYRFANDFKPERDSTTRWNGCVYFVFTASEFETSAEEIQLVRADLRVTLVPLSKNRAKDGGFLPDYDAIPRGEIPASFEHNARHLAENIAYYRHERIIDRMFAYAEIAAFIRGLKQARVDLEALASKIAAR